MDKKTLKMLVLVVIVAIIIVGAILLAGKGGDPKSEKAIQIDVATIYDAKAPPTLGTAKFKELVEERSNGAIQVNLFTSGALGSEKDIFNLLSGNELQMVLGGIQGVDQFATEYMFITAPYLITGWDHIRAILEGDLGRKMIKELDKKNVHIIGVNYRGIRNTTSNKPIKTPKDMNGLKLRLPEVSSWVATWKGIGAMPTPIALPELYGALQTKVVDASEGPYEQFATSKLFEVQKYVVNTNHVYEPCWLYISKSFLESLPKDLQEIITSSAKEAMLYADDLADKMAADFLKQCTDNGMTVIDPDLATFQEAAKPVLEKMFETTWTATTYDEVMEYSK